LASFVIDLDDDILAEVGQGDLGAEARTEVPDLVPASYVLRPGDLRLVLGSPPSRCSTISVVRFRALTLLTPAT
jgi:hypothetical protein